MCTLSHLKSLWQYYTTVVFSCTSALIQISVLCFRIKTFQTHQITPPTYFHFQSLSDGRNISDGKAKELLLLCQNMTKYYYYSMRRFLTRCLCWTSAPAQQLFSTPSSSQVLLSHRSSLYPENLFTSPEHECSFKYSFYRLFMWELDRLEIHYFCGEKTKNIKEQERS